MVILGIDPGTARVGYGVILEDRRGALKHIEGGVFGEPARDPGARLAALERGVLDLVKRYGISRAGVEKIYFVKNQKTGIQVAEARGVALLALRKRGVQILEFTPSEVKRAVTGSGRADKRAVALMLKRLVAGMPDETVLDDVTDALAVAVAASGRRRDFFSAM